MSDKPRLRGRPLERARAAKRAENPLCATGCGRPWTELDHVVPIEQGGSDDWDNLQGLCDECHDAKTRRDRNLRQRVTLGRDGFPIGAHPWAR